MRVVFPTLHRIQQFVFVGCIVFVFVVVHLFELVHDVIFRHGVHVLTKRDDVEYRWVVAVCWLKVVDNADAFPNAAEQVVQGVCDVMVVWSEQQFIGWHIN